MSVKLHRPTLYLVFSCYLFQAQMSRVAALRHRSFSTFGDFALALLVFLVAGIIGWWMWRCVISFSASLKGTPRVDTPPALNRLLQSMGYVFPRKLREEIFENAAGDLLQDWSEARRNHPHPLLGFIFFIRVCWLFVHTVLVGGERLLREIPHLAALFKIFGK